MHEHRLKVGERLKALRKARGWNQEDAAHHVGVAVKTWSNWERGRTDPYDANWRKIAEVFDVEPADIIGTPPAALGLGGEPAPVVAEILTRVAALETMVAELLELAKGHVAYTRNVVEGRPGLALAQTIERIDARQEAIIEAVDALLPSEDENLRAAAQAVADAAHTLDAGSTPKPSVAEPSGTPAPAPSRRRPRLQRPA